MRSAPSDRAYSRKALNLISRLHRISGLGVRPAWYSSRKCSNTLSQYSAAKLAVCSLIPSLSLTAWASARSSFAVQYSVPSSSSQFFMNRSEEHTSELQSRPHLVCRLLLEKKKNTNLLSCIPSHLQRSSCFYCLGFRRPAFSADRAGSLCK